MDLLPVRENQVIIVLRDCPVECRVYGWGHIVGGLTRLELTVSTHQSQPTLLTQFAGLPVLSTPYEYVELQDAQLTIELVGPQVNVYMGEEKISLVNLLQLSLDAKANAPKCRIRFLENDGEIQVLTRDMRDRLAQQWSVLRTLPWLEIEAPVSFRGPAMNMPGTLSNVGMKKHEE